MSPIAQQIALPPSVPGWALAAGAAVGVGAWAALRGRRAAGVPGALLVAARILLGAAGVWLGLRALGRVLVLAASWPVWPVALLAVVAAEAIVGLYGLERRVVSRRMGRALTALRLLLVALVALMLVQPVLASVFTETRKRTVAVLLDASASMRIADPRLPDHERLRLAEALGLPAARRPYRLDDRADAVADLRDALAGDLAMLQRLTRTAPDQAARDLARRREKLRERLKASSADAAEQARPLEAVLAEFADLPQALRTALLDAKATLSGPGAGRLADAADLLGSGDTGQLAANLPRLHEALRQAANALTKAEQALRHAGRDLDGLLYRMLGESDRAEVDAVSRLTRLQTASALLARAPTDEESARPLLAKLAEDYTVRVWTFAAEADETGPAAIADPLATATATATTARSRPAAPPPGAMATDLAGALREVLAAADDLAGVIVLSDGQDNGPDSPEPLARQLGARGASFCAAVVGSSSPPADAGIIAVESPDTVCRGDRVYANAELKLEGLKGRRVRVSLFDGEKRVDTREVRPSGDAVRTRVQLAHEPDKPGLHEYRLEVRPEGHAGRAVHEAFTGNNTYPVPVTVTREPTRLLLVDARPRWEFRYLKNLFRGRDRTVRLQYVLTDPDRYHGQPRRKPVPASAARPAGKEEATALPAGEAEWMKFDLIVLGDCSPADLARRLPPRALKAAEGRSGPAEVARILRKFVADRGGTLVLIAGPRAMPAACAGTALADLLPVGLDADDRRPACPREGARILLTDAGADHVALRQDVGADRSREIWRSLPPVYWHGRYLRASSAAEVLAFAAPAKPPSWLTDEDPEDAEARAELARRRREYQRDHALVVVAPHGLGRVMMLNTDRTWRLRYRVGDRRHHKLWGQIVRWATAGKLPAGTDRVRLGTDKTRYRPDERPIVRAKVVREDFSPVVTRLAVKVLDGDKPVARAPMAYVEDSPGLYRAALAPLPAGQYRLELELSAPDAKELLGEDEKPVSVKVSVAGGIPAEQVDLAATADGLRRLAQLSHNGAVVGAHQARRLRGFLPPGRMTRTRVEDFPLWDSWPLLVLFCLAATGEWVLRKRAGLT